MLKFLVYIFYFLLTCFKDNSGTGVDEAFSFGLDAEVEGDSESGSSEDQQVLLNDILACLDGKSQLIIFDSLSKMK